MRGTSIAAAAAAILMAPLTGFVAPAQAQDVTLRMHTFIPPVANPSKTF